MYILLYAHFVKTVFLSSSNNVQRIFLLDSNTTMFLELKTEKSFLADTFHPHCSTTICSLVIYFFYFSYGLDVARLKGRHI